MKKVKGFTLIELVIVIAIVGILVAIAVPTYTRYIQRARRADGQGALLDMSAQMERYFTLNNTYVGATLGTNPTTDIGSSTTSPDGWYQLSINSTATTYTLSATPLKAQTADTLCGVLSYNHQGVKGETGTGSVAACW